MAGYFKLEARINNEDEVESKFEAGDLSFVEILSLAYKLHYDVIKSVAKKFGLNYEETDDTIGMFVRQSCDLLLKLYLSDTKQEEKRDDYTRIQTNSKPYGGR